tara:strand:+ start:64 stop:306 length:243 start_codon:yes stop_codon:yes gene_type:complete
VKTYTNISNEYRKFVPLNNSMVNFSNQSKLVKEDFYKSKDGYIIFTEKYHLKRGYCCKSGCKHCPYGFNKKTDSLKKKLK